MKKLEKGTVTITLGMFDQYMSLDLFEKIVADARRRATDEGLRNLRVEIEGQRSYYDSVDISATIFGTRDETDEEFALRVQEGEQSQRATEEHERAEYERLRSKFEK